MSHFMAHLGGLRIAANPEPVCGLKVRFSPTSGKLEVDYVAVTRGGEILATVLTGAAFVEIPSGLYDEYLATDLRPFVRAAQAPNEDRTIWVSAATLDPCHVLVLWDGKTGLFSDWYGDDGKPMMLWTQ